MMKQPARSSVGAVPPLLLVALAGELLLFSFTGRNFATVANVMEVTRLSCEIGLLALALTPVILSGGIDLSVGSLMGLSAVALGLLWRDAALPIEVAAFIAILIGVAAGALNATLITRWKIPPLIVTLGSFSLFRGLAEGLTGGVDNVTDFPPRFLFLGQGYLCGLIPAQLPVLALVAVGYFVLVHRTIWGRSWTAIGCSAEGARYAGLPVQRDVAMAYMLCGAASSLSAVIYVAHLGQAKADAGLGYELSAISAVVLGGTSIYGGRGGISGTVLGMAAIAVLQNGLRLSDMPAELTGVLTGALLIGAMSRRRSDVKADPSVDAADTEPSRLASIAPPFPGANATRSPATIQEEFSMKTWHVVALCVSMLAAAAMIRSGNLQMAASVREVLKSHRDASHIDASSPAAPTRTPASSKSSGAPSGKPLTIAMMPKSKGNGYFIACRKGAEEAAAELGATLLWDGPTDPDPARQNEIIDTWIVRGVDVIAVAVENRDGISSVLRKAQQKGVPVVTWDSDAAPDSRSFFVNQATPEGIGQTLMDHAGRLLDGRGEFAIITASLTAANMIEWQKQIELHRTAKYPNTTMAVLRPCDDKKDKAFDEATAIMSAYPNVKLLMAICSPAVPGAAEAVKQAGRSDVKVIGLSLPNDNKRYIHEGVTDCIVLWNTADLGYLTVRAAHDVAVGSLKPGATEMPAGRLKSIAIDGDQILLGKPFTFTKENIDQFDF